jgi:hypothetical protein
MMVGSPLGETGETRVDGPEARRLRKGVHVAGANFIVVGLALYS